MSSTLLRYISVMFSFPAVKYSNIFPHFGEIRTEIYISHSLFILARQRQTKVTKNPTEKHSICFEKTHFHKWHDSHVGQQWFTILYGLEPHSIFQWLGIRLCFLLRALLQWCSRRNPSFPLLQGISYMPCSFTHLSCQTGLTVTFSLTPVLPHMACRAVV